MVCSDESIVSFKRNNNTKRQGFRHLLPFFPSHRPLIACPYDTSLLRALKLLGIILAHRRITR